MSHHGTRCECLLLAAATHARPDAITFSYCRDVLQRRYLMTCRHGEVEPCSGGESASGKWHDFGEMDAVKAILVTNT